MATKTRKVQGGVTDGRRLKTAVITARFKSDKFGETLSLQTGGTMIIVAFEAIMPLIIAARRAEGGK